MNHETLQPKEQLAKTTSENVASFSRLSESQIRSVVNSRKQRLEALKPEITLKAYYAIEEKIQNEEKRLLEILDWRLGRQKQLSKYTFILDPRFFEQEFLS